MDVGFCLLLLFLSPLHNSNIFYCSHRHCYFERDIFFFFRASNFSYALVAGPPLRKGPVDKIGNSDQKVIKVC